MDSSSTAACLAAAALAGICMACGMGPLSPGTHPDETKDRQAIYWNGLAPIPHTMDAIDVLREHAYAECKLAGDNWCADVHWHGAAFGCGTLDDGSPIMVEGCQPQPPICVVDIAWHAKLSDTALADELGHYVWEMCHHGATGERVIDAASNRAYDADYAAWIKAANADIAARFEQ